MKYLSLLALFLCTLVCLSVGLHRTSAASGDLNLTFDSDGKVIDSIPGGGNDQARGMAIQPDGKIVVAGSASNGGNFDFAVARYNSDGSLDATFGMNGKVTTPVLAGKDMAYSLALQSDGKIVVAGAANNGVDYDLAIVRYNANGSLDISFSGDGKTTTPILSADDVAYSVAIQPDGKIVAAGYASVAARNDDFAVVRYNEDGSLDTSFDVDGKVTTPVLELDQAYSMVIQPDGKIVAAGLAYGGNDDFALVRYNANGSLDTTFDGDGKLTTAISITNEHANALTIQPDGKLVAAGISGPDKDFALARYNVDGSLDTSFDGDGKVTTRVLASISEANAIAVQSDGKIVAVGWAVATDANFAVVRYNANGSLDNSFDGDGKVTTAVLSVHDYAYAVGLQFDGKIVAAGWSNGANDEFSLVRYYPDGSLDQSFDSDGRVTSDIGAAATITRATTLQPDGKIIAAGYRYNGVNYDFAVSRYNGNGSLDVTFGEGGYVTTQVTSGQDYANSVALQPDGKVVVAGYSGSDFSIVRYNRDGSLDNTFSSDGKATTDLRGGIDQAYSVKIQSDGKIVVAGLSFSGTNSDFALVRYNADGSPDASFDSDGKVTTAILSGNDGAYAIDIQSDGRIVAAGSAVSSSGQDFALVRYNANGSLDASFDGDGKVTTAMAYADSIAYSMAIQSDGKIVAAGYTRGLYTNFALARYNSDGTTDGSFGNNGRINTAVLPGENYAYSVVIQNDGKITAAGIAGTAPNRDFGIVRYNPDGSLDSTGTFADTNRAEVFGSGGVATIDFGGDDMSYGMVVDAVGRLVVVGTSDSRSAITRLLGKAPIRYELRGRLLTSEGRAIRRATISLTESSTGRTRVVQTGPHGNYEFNDLMPGDMCTVTAQAGRFVFQQPSSFVTLTNATTFVDFVAGEQRPGLVSR